MKNNKRAFTIVELVIVIAVIGILAAVLIPTFSSLIQKANMNSDEAAVKSMNTYLSADEQINGKPATWQDAVKVLSKSNLDAENYRALSSEHQLVWDASINRVLYVEKASQAVVYPEEYTADGMLDLGYKYGTWTTLEGKMVADDSWRYNVTTSYGEHIQISNDKLTSYKDKEGNVYDTPAKLEEFISSKEQSGEYVDYFGGNQAANLAAMEYKNNAEIKSGFAEFTVGSEKYYISKVNKAEQLFSFTQYVQEPSKNNGKNYTLVLTDDVDLNSTQWKPIETYAGNIDGGVMDENGEIQQAKVTNFALSDRSAEVKMYKASTKYGSYFYYGFISVFTGNYLGNLSFEGLDVTNPGLDKSAPAGFKKSGHVTGVLAGNVYNDDNDDVLIENITIGSGTITGLSRVGGVVGMVGGTGVDAMEGGSVTFKNIVNNANVVSEASVSSAHATAGGFVAMFYNIAGGKFVFENCVNNGNVTGAYAGGFLAYLGNASSGMNPAEADYEVEFKKCTNNGQINGIVSDKKFESETTGNILTDTFSTPPHASGFISKGDTGKVKSVDFIGCVNNGLITLSNSYDSEKAQNANLSCVASSFIPAYLPTTFTNYVNGDETIENYAKDEFSYNLKYEGYTVTEYKFNN